jgi:hypothetical protein
MLKQYWCCWPVEQLQRYLVSTADAVVYIESSRLVWVSRSQLCLDKNFVVDWWSGNTEIDRGEFYAVEDCCTGTLICNDWVNSWCKLLQLLPEPEFVNLLRSPGIDSQPGGIDSWAPETYTNTGSEIDGAKGTAFQMGWYVSTLLMLIVSLYPNHSVAWEVSTVCQFISLAVGLKGSVIYVYNSAILNSFL